MLSRGKFIRDTTCRILSESAKFQRRYDKNISPYFVRGYGVHD